MLPVSVLVESSEFDTDFIKFNQLKLNTYCQICEFAIENG